MKEQMNTQNISQKNSIGEEQLEKVTEPIFKHKTETVIDNIHTPPSAEFEAITQIAKSKDIDYVALIREWITEKIYASK
jgi:hypothetical protein